MAQRRATGEVGRKLELVAAELASVSREARAVGLEIEAAIGGSATAADRNVRSALAGVSGSADRAADALYVAASRLRR